MTKGELNNFTPPNTQFLKSGKPSTHIIKFAERIGAKIVETMLRSTLFNLRIRNTNYHLICL